MKKVLLTGLLGLVFCVAHAQKYNIKTYSVNDGLPSSQVYDVHLDEEGLVWFATAYGLVEFDGFTFESYGEENGLRDELIYDIFEDSKKRFWVSTDNGGVGLLKGDSVEYSPAFTKLDTMLINYITESPTGNIWFGTNSHGVQIWEDSVFTTYDTGNGLPSNQIWDIQFLRGNEAWIGTMNGVAVYRKGEGIVKTWTEENGLSGFSAYQVFEASDKTIWIPTSSGITLISPDNELSTITKINGEELAYVYNINEDNEGVIWIGTERNGLYWYDGEEYTHITKKNGLSSNHIYRLIKANDGTIWVASDGNGVSIFKDKQFKFFDRDTEVNSSSIYSLFLDDEGTIWYGKDGSIGSIKNGDFKTYDIPEEVIEEDEIWEIEQLPNGNLIMLTYNYWLIEFDGTKFFKSQMNEPLMEYYINDIFVDDNDEIWFATGVSLINYNDGDLKEFVPSTEYWQSYVNIVFKDSKGNFWLGTEGGLAKFDGKDFVFYTEEEGLDGPSIYEIKEGPRGNIWVGTNEGLSVIKSFGEGGKSEEIERFETNEIFLPETISLLFDKEGGLWQGTNAGLNYYNVEKWHTTGEMDKVHFALQDYGKGIEFNGWAAVRGEDGKLWFGTSSRGLLQYDYTTPPSSAYEKEPSTFIRRVFANGEEVYNQNSKNPGFTGINLPYDRNNIEIEYGAVNYKDPNRIFYRYKLGGFEEEWNAGFDKREANYTNLNPGDYVFSVMSKSTTSEWGDSPTTISINIARPFWTTWWFIVLGFLIVGGVIFFYVQMYLNIMEKKKLRVLVNEQTADLQIALDEKEVLIKEIHHRVKNNMAVVSGLLELQSWKMSDGQAKAAIENSKLRIKTMSTIHEKLYQSDNFSNVNIKDFVSDLIDNISSSLKAADQDIAVLQDVEVSQMDVNKAIPCGLLLNELICNSFEHAFPGKSNGTIEVSFKENEKGYQLIVKDNGIGISENILQEKRSSLGLTLAESLIGQIRGELSIKNNKGTTIAISIPKE